MEGKEGRVSYGVIVAKAWEDEKYRKEFIEDPESKLAEAGIPVAEGVTYKVIEAPKMVQYVVLPFENVKEAMREFSKLILNKSEKTDLIIPAGFEARIIQDTADTRYLILPASPKTLTAAELAVVAGGGVTTTYTNVEVSAEVVVTTVEAQTCATTTTAAAEAEVAVVVVGVCVLI